MIGFLTKNQTPTFELQIFSLPLMHHTLGVTPTSFFATSSDVSVINAEVLTSEFIIEHSLPLSVLDHCSKIACNVYFKISDLVNAQIVK